MTPSRAQIRIGAAIAYLQQDSLGGAGEQVSPMLTLAPEFRISTVTGYLDVLDEHLGPATVCRQPGCPGPAAGDPRLPDCRAAATRWGDQMTLPVQMTDRGATGTRTDLIQAPCTGTC